MNSAPGASPNWQQSLVAKLTQRKEAGLLRTRKLVLASSPTEVLIEGQRLISFASNDYLGLGWRAQPQSLLDHSPRVGAGASPLVSGRGSEYLQLEQRLADFEQTESALLFSSGYAANVGVISAIASEGDLLLSDAENHASIIDGCRLSRARIMVFRHRDVDHLRSLLKEHRSAFRNAFIVTDSVFSMAGDLADLSSLCQLAASFEAQMVVDEAHATGIYGERGAGLVEELGLKDRISIRLGTLSKAIGSQGGFLACSNLLADYVSNFARSYVYSTALPPCVVRNAFDSIEHIERCSAERQMLREKSRRLRVELRGRGLDAPEGDSPIIPVYFESSEQVLDAEKLLRSRGIYAPAIRPPSVPIGTFLLRISLSVHHSSEQLHCLSRAFG